MNPHRFFSPIVLLVACASLSLLACSPPDLGTFENHGDIGAVGQAGQARHDAGRYVVGGSGTDMWYQSDEFHFVWKQASGDLSIASDIEFLDNDGDPHKKAFVMFRQSLDPDAAYADAVVHGDGLTSIQYRETKGDDTHEVQSNMAAPRRISLHKEGDYVYMQAAGAGEDLESTGGMFKIRFTDPFYVGIGITAHNNEDFEEAAFTDVTITEGLPEAAGEPVLESSLERIIVDNTDRRVVYRTVGHIEAPNWTHDGQYLIYNSGGLLYRIPAEGGTPEQIDTGFANRLNNDHGISPDGTQLVISDGSQGDNRSRIYILPIEGGTPRPVVEQGPAYWHGWSPDGKTLAYVAQRNGDYDIYSIPVTGGLETRLTTAEGLDDGPDYSPDGEYIYFNSVRTGTMQIYRMKPDGSEQEQLTSDEYNDWFPHPSPDGQWIVFLSYEPDVEGHPANQDVMIRMMPADGGDIQVLAKLFGGQGTINVPSWSPDSEHVAFVSYRLAVPR